MQTRGILIALEGRRAGLVPKQRAPELPPVLTVGMAGQGHASVSPRPNGAAGGAAGSPPALPSLLQPTQAGGMCARSQRRWMLSGNHGNRQVSVSLPLPVTLRCHHVPVTSRAPHVPPAHLRRLPRRVWQGDTVAAGPCLGSPRPLGARTKSRHPTAPGLCWGSRGSPHPQGCDPAPWGGGGSPRRPVTASPALAASLPSSASGRSPARRTKQHLQALNHAAGPALPEIARWGGLPCQH